MESAAVDEASVKLAALLPSTDYAQFPLMKQETRRKQSRAASRRWAESSNLLPFRVPCPTPVGSKVYIEPVGLIARSLLGAVLR